MVTSAREVCRKPGRIVALAAAIGVALVGFVGVAGVGEPDPGSGPVPGIRPVEGTEATPAPERAPLTIGAWTAQAGEHFTYVLRLDTAIAMSSRMPNARQQSKDPLRISSRGVMTVAVVDRRPEGILLRYAFPELRVWVLGDETGTSRRWTDRIGAAMRSGFIVRTGEDGRTLGLRFPAGIGADHRNWARTVVTAFRFVVPANAGAEWETDEEQTMGRFRMRYVRDGSTVERTRLTFVPRGQAGHLAAAPALSGKGVARFGCDTGWLSTAKIDEKLDWTLAKVRLRICYEMRGELSLRSSGRAEASAANWTGPWVPISGHEERSEALQEMQEKKWRDQLAGVTLEQLVAKVRRLLAGGARDELFETLHLLGLLIRQRPETADAIRELVQQARVEGDLAGVLLSALGMAGSAPAQGSLVTVFEDVRLAVATRSAAVESMFQVAKPNGSLVASLQRSLVRASRIDTGLGATTLLVMGALSSRGSETAMRDLLGHEAKARSSGVLMQWFESLGNSGSPLAVPVARRYLAQADPELRAHALTAIRRVETPQALELLRGRAVGDASASVRARAAEILGERPGDDTSSVLTRLATRDGDSAVRRAAILGLARRLRREPGLRDVLARITREDGSEEIRQLVRRVLRSS